VRFICVIGPERRRSERQTLQPSGQQLELLVGAELAQVVDDVLNLQAVHRCGVIEALGLSVTAAPPWLAMASIAYSVFSN